MGNLRHRSGRVATLDGERSGWQSTYDLWRGLGQRESPGHGLEELVAVECWGASWWQEERCGRVGWEEKTER